MTYIRHITLMTGHTSSIEAGDVSGEAMARVGPWLNALVARPKQDMPLPVAALASYTGMAHPVDGAVIITISGIAPTKGPMSGKRPPLVSLGVAQRSRHGAKLWGLMTGPATQMGGCTIKPGLQRPPEPWAAVAVYPTLALHPEAAEWLGDLERCLAWAWCHRSGVKDGD